MRKLVLALVLPALALGTIAADDVETFEPCGPDLAHPVLAAGDTLSESPTDEGVAAQFYVDPTVEDRGRINVSAVLSWTNPVNDWDLDVNGILSDELQPVAEPVEQASFSARGDCKLVTVSVINFTAVAEAELGMTLDITVG